MADYKSIADTMRNRFNAEERDYHFRRQQLVKFREMININKDKIIDAAFQDLGRPSLDTIFADFLTMRNEADHAIKHLKKWMKPTRVKLEITLKPGKAYLQPMPKGVVLVIGPWNYPFNLTLAPVVGAIAAGNSIIIKPSELTPTCSALIKEMFESHFDGDYIKVIEGGPEETQEILDNEFDHIFFTGGTTVGKIIYKRAAEHLTPVTLELGGKSPTIVDESANLEVAAKRIIVAKYANAGQTCIAPDYLFVKEAVREKFLETMKKYIREFYGQDPNNSDNYGRIVNERHYNRLLALLENTKAKIELGGKTGPELHIGPTILTNVAPDDVVMDDEIFGPILPVFPFEDISEVLETINSKPHPLVIYYYSNDKKTAERIIQNTNSGAFVMNESVIQAASSNLPLRGVGDSGIGQYHGKHTFDTFSYNKSVLLRSFRFDLSLRYPPMTGFKKKIIDMITK